ncbi:MAG: glycosyltransferase family 1 protein [Candidatus Ornithomonoglobus sp.]
MIRILHSVSNMDRAGIETMLMNYYRHIDRDKVQFDFLCNKKKPGAYDDEIKSMGGRIFRTPGLNPAKYPKYMQFMNNLFKENPEYQIIEAHNGALGVYALHCAKLNNIPTRIFHAHGASITKDLKWPLKMFCRSRLKYNINHKFTCGIAAARCYFGNKAVKNGDYELIPNAIETDRFTYNEAVRETMKSKYKLHGKKIIGHVGRFMKQKNHEFLLNVFAELHKSDPDTYLVLLGDGELLNKMKRKAEVMGFSDSVYFAGNVANANEWYSVFDVFVLPSIWEGLPVVGIEAQAAGLPCIFSDNVTNEIAITDNVRFIGLGESVKTWTDAIREYLDIKERKDNSASIANNRYDIKLEARKLQERYIELYEGAI